MEYISVVPIECTTIENRFDPSWGKNEASGKRVPGRFAREASFFDVEEREEAVAPSSTAAQKNRFCGSSVKHEPVLLGQGALGLTLTINDVKCW